MALLALLAIVLAACGGDPANPPANSAAAANPPVGPIGTVVPPTPFNIAASLSTVKRLTLAWPSSPADRALVFEDPDGEGPLPAEQVADVPAANGTATVEIFLPVALQASYHVELCAAGRCVSSAPLRLQGTLEQAMGRIKALSPQSSANFGESLALSSDGQVLAVGAMRESDTVPFQGVVHLFERGGAGQDQWVPRGLVVAPNPGNNDRFGTTVALSSLGDVLVVGAEYEDALGTSDTGANDAATDAGAVYIYRRQGDEWVFEAYLKGSEVNAGDYFGSSVGLSGAGDTLVVGSLNDDGANDAHENEGAAYVFTHDGVNWKETQLLRSSLHGESAFYGYAVTISADGTVLCIGSPSNRSTGRGVYGAETPIDNTGASDSSGAVFLYQQSPAGDWILDAFVKPALDLGSGRFGNSLGLDASGQTLLVGAYRSDVDLQNTVDQLRFGNSGSAHVFVRESGQWQAHGQPLRPPRPRNADWFGDFVSLSSDGQTVVIGTQNNGYTGIGVSADEDSAYQSTAGAAYVFRRRADGWGPAVVLKPSDRVTDSQGLAGVRLGSAVAISGDGRLVAVGASGHSGPGSGPSPDPTISYGYEQDFLGSGAVFLY